jgi:FMN phosphatase YigB (HAD superfamily)
MIQSKIVLLDIDYTLFDTAHHKKSNLLKYQVYTEVQETLSELVKIARLGIFSEGDLFNQKKKLRETNIDKFFSEEHIHIVEKKFDVVQQMLHAYRKKGQLFLVDDKLTILHIAKQLFPSVYTIWVKRGEYARKQKPIKDFLADAEVELLHEIVPIIANQ